MKAFWLTLLFVLGGFCTCWSGDIGFGVGMVQTKNSSNQDLWFVAMYRLTVWNHMLLEPEVGYWSDSQSDTTCRSSGCLHSELSRSDADVAFHALYSIQTGAMRLSFGGGPGVHYIRSSSSLSLDDTDGLFPIDISMSRHYTKAAAHFLAELDAPMWGRLSVFAAIRNELVQSGNNNFKLYGGARFAIP